MASVTAYDTEPLGRGPLDWLPAHVAILNDQGTILAVNAAWTAFENRNDGGRGTGVGANYLQVCERAEESGAASEAALVATGLRDVLAGDRDEVVVEYACHSATERRWFVMRAARFFSDGEARAIVQHENVTARRVAEDYAGLRSRLLDAVDAAVVALGADGRVTTWNRGAEILYGWSSGEALGRAAVALFVPRFADVDIEDVRAEMRATGRWEGEVEVQRKDGSRFPAYVRNSALEAPGGQFSGSVGVSVDVTERLRAERGLRAARDYTHAVTESIGDGLCTLDAAGGIVYLNPKAVELLGWTTAETAGRDFHETLHHQHADGSPFPAEECPLVLGRRTRSAVRVEDDVLVRRDGSLLPIRQVMTPFETEDGVDGFVLVFGDISKRKAKERDAQRKLQDFGWIEQIRYALDHERLVLHAQPIVDMATGAVVQHELLIRMHDEDGGTVAPGQFLPIAENYGLIGEIDRWVVRQSIALAAQGRAVELNVSAHSLSDRAFADYVDAELRNTGADPGLLIFELTETALLQDEAAALRFIAAIKQHGCGLALDDFGTGYGGFSYLKRLPVDYLKIDIEFVRDVTVEPASRQVVDAVVSLARGFGIKTVAEGVEDDATLALLRERGVDYGQGYGIGRPTPLENAFRAGEQR